MRILDFTSITEEQGKTAVFAFGRMNPPTIGHKKLADAVLAQAGDPYIFLSQSQKPQTDPLDFATKLKFAQKFFPGITVGNPEVKTVIQALTKLDQLGYDNIIYIAGSDRIADFTELLNQYNGQPDKKGNVAYKFNDIQVVSAGERDPDAEGAEGMSASKMRAAAAAGEFEAFASGTPDPKFAKPMYDAVRSGMGIAESTYSQRMLKVIETLSDLNRINPFNQETNTYILEQVSIIKEHLNNINEATLDLPDLETGDELMVGKFKNRKATIKDFKTDEHGQPVAVTNKGDQKIFKGRVKKLMPTEGKSPHKKGTEKYRRHMAAMHASAEPKGTMIEGISYADPQFDVEWEEANRYPYIEKLGSEGWEELAKTGRAVRVTTDSVKKIGNTGADGSESLDDLEPEKVARLKQAMDSGTVEMPIVVKQPDGSLELIAGNTRLIGLISTQGEAQVWLVDASTLTEDESRDNPDFNLSDISPELRPAIRQAMIRFPMAKDRLSAVIRMMQQDNEKQQKNIKNINRLDTENDIQDVEIDTSEDDITSVKNKIAALEKRISSEQDITNLKNKISDLEARIVPAKESMVKEVTIDNKNGRGAVPNNQEVDYFGMRVNMKPSTFIALASKLGKDPEPEMIDYIKKGGAIGAPFLSINSDETGEKAEVTGHEGRNRMLAIMKAEGDVPVEVHLFFNSDQVNRARHLTPELVSAIKQELISQDDNLVKGPLWEGVGRIVKGVNTTPDVGVNQTKIEAAKLGSKVDKDGRPPLLHKKAAKNSDTNTLFNLGLAEGKLSENNKSHAVVIKFVNHCKDKLELPNIPTITLVDRIGGKTFGQYNTVKKDIAVQLADRHIVDVLRTLAHELVHHKQRHLHSNLDGSDGSDHENQANALAGKLMRQFGKRYPKLYEGLQERASIGVPLSSGLTVNIAPHRELKIKKSTMGRHNYENPRTKKSRKS